MLLEELIRIFKYMDEDDRYIDLKDFVNNNCKPFAIKDNGWFGVAIELKLDDMDFYEEFENGKVLTQIKNYENSNHKILELVSNEKEAVEQFALLCNDFIEFFNDNYVSDIFDDSKCKWLEKWKNILGNTNRKESPYSLLAELMVLRYYIEKGEKVYLSNQGTHDIESQEMNYEVKSTIERYSNDVHINSQYQMIPNNAKKLKLVFVRLEKSQSGHCINEIIESLIELGYDKKQLDHKRECFSTSSLNEIYKVLEAKVLEINDDFPKITNESFKDNRIPKGVKKIEYIVDLSDIESEKIDLN